jgi:Phytanoyl-CoA dioxygenase (PhyH)
VLPLDLLEQCRWVTAEFSAGDVLVFPSLTVHAARHNASELFLRLSVDFRYQPEHEPLTSGCLEPHFGRLAWDEIYEGWSSTEHQYYWRDLDFEVVPFEEFDLVDADVHEATAEFLHYEKRVTARFDRRRERDELSSAYPVVD